MLELRKDIPFSEDEIKEFLEKAAWYHSIRFSPTLKSIGVYDHENHIDHYGLPSSLAGKTVLDIGSSDGFFSFELEKRGAQEVLAIDTNKYNGELAIDPSKSKIDHYQTKYTENSKKNDRFSKIAKYLGLEHPNLLLLSKKLLNSSVEFRNLSIYDVESLNKKFDLVFCGDLIEHLKNPLEAVEKIHAVTKEMCIITTSSVAPVSILNPMNLIDPRFRNRVVTYWGDSGGSFFHFSAPAFKKVLLASGFKKVVIYSEFKLKNKKTGERNLHVVYHCWA